MIISRATSDILDQLIAVISQIGKHEYSMPLPIYNGSTIGKHFRHIHDFYSCLVDGSEQSKIDYCQRERIEKLEIDPQSLVTSLEILRSKLLTLDPDTRIRVCSDFEYENGERPQTESSLGREMLYAYDHAVHHLAIIKLGIKAEFPEIKINDTIGVAASTLRHQFTHPHDN